MSDNLQKTQFPQGVNTPVLENVTSISYADGMTVTTTPSPVLLALGGGNVGSFTFALADGMNFNGKYNFKVTIGTAIAFVSMEVASQAYVGSPKMTHIINITGASESDKDVLQFKTALLMKNPVDNRHQLQVSFNTNAPGATNATVTVDAWGNPAPVNIALASGSYSTVVSTKTLDVRDAFEILTYRNNGQNVSLNNIKTPGIVSVNPTDVPSRPSGSAGIGVCVTKTVGDSALQLTQEFTDTSTGSIYTRYMTSDGVTWSAWSKVLRENDAGNLINQSVQSQMLGAIVFG